jgi:acyl-CoA synthetase (AMP-forming)/AMP-acid ligase II
MAPLLRQASAQTELLIGEVFRSAARSVPNRTAVDLGERSLTFGEIDRAANRLGRTMRDLGAARGERVAVVGAMNPSLVPVFAASAKLGAVYAAIDPELSPDALLDVLQVARPSLVVIDDERATSSRELATELGVPAIGLARLVRSSAGDDDRELPVAGPNELDPQAVFFRANGIGRPKGAVLSHRVQYLRSQFGALPGRRGPAVCPYSLSRSTAWEIALRQWHARGRVVLVDPRDPTALCEAVEAQEAAHLTAPPSLLRELLALATADPDRARQLRSLREINLDGRAAPRQLLDEVASVLPRAKIRLVHGCVEAGDLACLEGSDLYRKPGSCGVPAPFGELIVEQTGELCVRGPLLFDGYLGDADATAAAVVDGWYHTGDVAELDREDFLTILGPLRDLIQTRSGAVAPIEVETAIAGHSGVGDVAVIGLPSPDLDQVVCAVVVPAPGHDPPSLAELQSFCENRIETFKQPGRLLVVDAIPRTEATRQVQRPLLYEQLA